MSEADKLFQMLTPQQQKDAIECLKALEEDGVMPESESRKYEAMLNRKPQ